MAEKQIRARIRRRPREDGELNKRLRALAMPHLAAASSAPSSTEVRRRRRQQQQNWNDIDVAAAAAAAEEDGFFYHEGQLQERQPLYQRLSSPITFGSDAPTGCPLLQG